MHTNLLRAPLSRLLLLGGCLSLLVLPEAKAQLGLAAVYGTDTELGAQLSYYQPLNLSGLAGVRVGGDVTFYLPDDFGNEFYDATATYFEINANGHYAFLTEPARQFYGLAGLNYSRVSVSIDGDDDFPGGDGSSDDVGVNVGAGAQFGNFFGEAKFTLSGFDQLMLALGYRF